MPNQDYILISRQGLASVGDHARATLSSLPKVSSTQSAVLAELAFAPGHPLEVVDSIGTDGPRLVRMDTAVALSVNAASGPVRAVPVVTYDLPDAFPFAAAVELPTAEAAAVTDVVVQCIDAANKAPISNARIVLVSNVGQVKETVTGPSGEGMISITGSTVDRLYVDAGASYWGAYRTQIPIRPGQLVVPIGPVTLPFRDAIKTYYGNSRFDPTTGVTVAVVDTGVGPHRDLNIAAGFNTVTGEQANDYSDWKGHGTHVAGLIGAKADAAGAEGVRGLAPGAAICAFRVFGKDSKNATNYAILKAMILAATHQCDIVNLSLGGGPYDEIVEESILDARNQGMVVIIAAGNGGRKAVNYPACYSGATAVSALGLSGSFPTQSLPESDFMTPPLSEADPNEFIARFSNVGPQISVTAPGVGVLSTLPNDRYGPNSGTSMAAPVVAGAAACLLSRDAQIFRMPRNRTRSDAIERLLLTNCTRRGFGSNFEGFGLPDPMKI